MSFFSKLKAGIGNILAKAAPVVSAITSVLPLPNVARTAINLGIQGASNALRGVTALGDEAGRLFGSMQGITGLQGALRNTALSQLQSAGTSANSYRNMIEAQKSQTLAQAGAVFGSNIVFTGDLLFNSINLITNQNKHTMFAVPKPRSILTKPSPNTFASFGQVFVFTSTSGIGPVIQISEFWQAKWREFLNTKSIMDLTTVTSLIDILGTITSNLDNPYDFLNLLGYEGPEVVTPIAKLDVPIVNGVINKIARHKATKSLQQWFAAVGHFRDQLRDMRIVVADWLGSSVDDYEPVFIDMLSFYVIITWGQEYVEYLFEMYATHEMYDAIPQFAEKHKYDQLDVLHYALNSAKVGWDLAFIAAATPATEAQACPMRYAMWNLTLISVMTSVMRMVVSFTSFGLDDGDVDDIHKSLVGIGNTDPADYWGNIQFICNQDNADLLAMDNEQWAEVLAEASVSAADIVITDEYDLISAARLESMVIAMEQEFAKPDLTSIDFVRLVALVESNISNFEAGVAAGKIDEPDRVSGLVVRLKALLVRTRAGIVQ